MSPSPQSESNELDLAHEQQWVVHDLLVSTVDDHLDDGDQPPEWTIDVVESLESNRFTITDSQAEALRALLEDRKSSGQLSPAEQETLETVIERLEAVRQSA